MLLSQVTDGYCFLNVAQSFALVWSFLLARGFYLPLSLKSYLACSSRFSRNFCNFKIWDKLILAGLIIGAISWRGFKAFANFRDIILFVYGPLVSSTNVHTKENFLRFFKSIRKHTPSCFASSLVASLLFASNFTLFPISPDAVGALLSKAWMIDGCKHSCGIDCRIFLLSGIIFQLLKFASCRHSIIWFAFSIKCSSVF